MKRYRTNSQIKGRKFKLSIICIVIVNALYFIETVTRYDIEIEIAYNNFTLFLIVRKALRIVLGQK